MGEHFFSTKPKIAIGLVLITSLSTLGGGCSLWNKRTPTPTTSTNQAAAQPPVVNDSSLGQALISMNDVRNIEGMTDTRPAIIELNDHLDTTMPGDYNFYVAQIWYDRQSSNTRMQTAITQLSDLTAAQNIIVEQAKGYAPLVSAKPVGDKTVVYYQAPTDTSTAKITYRFTVGQYSAKVQLYSVSNPELSDTETQATMLPIVYELAKIQASKLNAFLTGSYVAPEPTTAMDYLPATLENTTLVGKVPMTDQEWLGVSFDMERDALNGFVSGGMSRFTMNANKDEVAEVVVMEFETPDDAKTFQTELTSSDDDETTEINVNDDLSVDQVDAIRRPGLVELQAVKNNFVIDVSVFAPFAADDEPREEDVLTISKEVLENF